MALSDCPDDKTAAIDAELAAVAQRAHPDRRRPARRPARALRPAARARRAGSAPPPLRARECGGCRLTVDNAEMAVIKAAPSDEVIRCEECQRILVRTSESGL